MRTVVVSFSLIGLSVLLFNAAFTIAIPAQEYSCLNASYFLVDKSEKKLERDRLIAFYLPNETEFFPLGSRWIKLLVGMPGDEVVITENSVTVNGHEYVNNMKLLLMKLKMDRSEVERKITLGSNEYFMVGETPLSYDSRFWGVISEENVIGNAYAIL
ncbi:signal peptidase I [Shewanella sp. UCD-KL12]|uniref:signal peptidase I n=1 Tax=Shewanella sp. UCD-KL12 TaxID=1917163 RepID=UPI000970B819|nr:signal peptidase I [Shewanella sp. UCD-KL12]